MADVQLNFVPVTLRGFNVMKKVYFKYYGTTLVLPYPPSQTTTTTLPVTSAAEAAARVDLSSGVDGQIGNYISSFCEK